MTPLATALICAALTLACLVGLGLFVGWHVAAAAFLLCAAAVVMLFWLNDRVSNWPPAVALGLAVAAVVVAGIGG